MLLYTTALFLLKVHTKAPYSELCVNNNSILCIQLTSPLHQLQFKSGVTRLCPLRAALRDVTELPQRYVQRKAAGARMRAWGSGTCGRAWGVNDPQSPVADCIAASGFSFTHGANEANKCRNIRAGLLSVLPQMQESKGGGLEWTKRWEWPERVSLEAVGWAEFGAEGNWALAQCSGLLVSCGCTTALLTDPSVSS